MIWCERLLNLFKINFPSIASQNIVMLWGYFYTVGLFEFVQENPHTFKLPSSKLYAQMLWNLSLWTPLKLKIPQLWSQIVLFLPFKSREDVSTP